MTSNMGVRQPFYRLRPIHAPHQEVDSAEGPAGLGQHAQAPRLDQADQRLRRAAVEPAARNEHLGAVIGDQHEALIQGPQRQIALADARRTFDQRAAPGSRHPAGDQAGMADHSRGPP